LLYIGLIVLKDLILPEHFDHFMLLHTAVRILCDPHHCVLYLQIARKILSKFVFEFPEIYGSHSVSINIHCLLHICDDVELYCHLDNFSAFPYKNFMTPIKEFLAANHHPLEQVVKRSTEMSNAYHIPSVRNILHNEIIHIPCNSRELNEFFKIYYYGSKLDKVKRNVYHNPFSSEHIDIYSSIYDLTAIETVNLKCLDKKCFAMP
jgi:hypothetical protein